MLIASTAIFIYLKIKKNKLLLSLKGSLVTLFTGFIIAAHWICFFEAINQSNVSVTLASLSTASLFTAILEPIFFKRRIHLYELLLGVMVIIGLYFIFAFEPENSIGIYLAILAAFLASLFTVINGRLIKRYSSGIISFYELSGGIVAISFYLLFFKPNSFPSFDLSLNDMIYIGILGLICTAFAFVASVKVMQDLTPFTVSLSINLEPVYGILMALIIFGDEEKMSAGFYIGALLILCSLFLNVIVKRRKKRIQKRTN